MQSHMADVEWARRAGRDRSLVVIPSRSVERSNEPAAVTKAFE